MTDHDNAGMTATAEPTPETTTTAEPPGTDLATPPARETVAEVGDDDTITIPTPVAGLPLTFTKHQVQLNATQMRLLAPLGIEATFDPGQVMVFLLDCRARGFNPWAKEAYLYKIAGKYISHVGIEGMRRKAEESGEYRGPTPPEFCGPDGKWTDVWVRPTPPLACRVGVYRAGFAEPTYRPVYWEEYCPLIDEEIWIDKPRGEGRIKKRTGNKVPAANWRPAATGGKPLTMIAKVAEAASLRAAFPNRFQGYYVPEETAKMRVDADTQAAAEAATDGATERRRAAYAKAAAQTAEKLSEQDSTPLSRRGQVIDSTAVETTPDTPEQFRDLALDELDMQADVLGRDVDWMTRRWSKARADRPWDTATPAEVVEHVLRFRPYIIDALRAAGDDTAADAYEAAGTTITTVAQLLGRAAPTPEETPPHADHHRGA